MISTRKTRENDSEGVLEGQSQGKEKAVDDRLKDTRRGNVEEEELDCDQDKKCSK